MLLLRARWRILRDAIAIGLLTLAISVQITTFVVMLGCAV